MERDGRSSNLEDETMAVGDEVIGIENDNDDDKENENTIAPEIGSPNLGSPLGLARKRKKMAAVSTSISTGDDELVQVFKSIQVILKLRLLKIQKKNK